MIVQQGVTENQPVPGLAPRPVEVGVALILRNARTPTPTGGRSENHTHDILITKRLANTVYAGYWELPGGKIDPGESPTHAAIREVQEELGLNVLPIAQLAPIQHTYEHATVRLHPVICSIAPQSPPPANLQVAEHRWVAINSLPWEEFLPANVRIITALVRWIAGGGAVSIA